MTDTTISQGEQPGAITATPTDQQPAAVAPVDPSAMPPAAQETGAQDTAEAEAKPRDPETGRFAKRTEQLQSQISDLTAQKRGLERDIQAQIRQAKALENQWKQASNVDPANFEANESARTQRAVIGVQHGLVQEQAAETARRIAENRGATFMAKVDAARERIPDIDTTLRSFASLPVSDVAADLIAESDKSVEIANYLGRNPHEAHRIAQMHPAYQGAEIARIEARVSAMPMKRISQAPAPVSTVSGGSGNPSPDLGSLSMKDYIKAREQQQR